MVDKDYNTLLLVQKYGVKDLGGYNDMPLPYRACDPMEMWRFESTYCPTFSEYRQVKGLDKYMISIKILWFHDRGYSWHYDHGHLYNGQTESDIIKCWRIGCDHKNMKELNGKESREIGVPHFGMCWHVYKCPDCGFVETQDSSD